VFKLILFSLLSFNLFGLELSISGAKQNHTEYATLHLKDPEQFLCQETLNDFKVVTQIVCAFTKKPPKKLKLIQNNFFKIENKIKNKTFFLIITPYQKIKLYPMIFNMTKNTSLFDADVKLADHWMIVGFKEKMPFIKEEKKSDVSIDFPFELNTDKLPYIGGLDIKGNPVHIKRVGDVTDYLKIKKLFENKKYTQTLDMINDVMLEYPNSLFNAELLYYKIKSYAKLEDNDNVVEMSKTYLNEFSSDENVPEVLALTAYAYHKIGLDSDAEYFFDRLFTEHDGNEYARLGFVYMGIMEEENAAVSKALSYYKRALNETQRIDIASFAAYRLARYHVLYDNKDEGKKYVDMIAYKTPEYFIHDLTTSMNMMYKAAEYEDYETAATIAKAITDSVGKQHDEHENLMKDRAMWLSKTDDKKKALEALNAYQEEYNSGMYEDMIAVAKDELFFDTNEGNFTVKLDEYNALIDEYPNDTIGDRAIYEKAKLLLNNDMYDDVLEMKDLLLSLDQEIYEDVDTVLKDAAVGVMKIALASRQCEEVLYLSNDYNITLSNEWDDGVYECSMVGANFTLSKEIASRNLNDKDLEQRKKWLYRYINVDFQTGNYTNIIEPSKELVTLIEDDNSSTYDSIYRVIFDTYQRLENDEKILESIVKIQEVFGISYKDIERYVAVMSLGEKNKDDNLVIQYGEEVMKIQNSSNSNAQSPFVEFTLYQSYINREQYEKALETIKSLDTIELNKTDRARQKYLLGTVYNKLWRGQEAIEAFEASITADPNSPWAKLATTAKGI